MFRGYQEAEKGCQGAQAKARLKTPNGTLPPNGVGDPRPPAGNCACREPTESSRKSLVLTAIKSPTPAEPFSSLFWQPQALASINSISCRKPHEKIVAPRRKPRFSNTGFSPMPLTFPMTGQGALICGAAPKAAPLARGRRPRQEIDSVEQAAGPGTRADRGADPQFRAGFRMLGKVRDIGL